MLITAGSPPTELEARLHLALQTSESKMGPMSSLRSRNAVLGKALALMAPDHGCVRRFEAVERRGPAFARLPRGKYGSAGGWRGSPAGARLRKFETVERSGMEARAGGAVRRAALEWSGVEPA